METFINKIILFNKHHEINKLIQMEKKVNALRINFQIQTIQKSYNWLKNNANAIEKMACKY